MRKTWLYFALLSVAAAGCSSPPPSDDEIFRHTAAIDQCYVPIYFRLLKVEFREAGEAQARGQTPGPTPTMDDHDLRLCYLAKVNKATLDPKITAKTKAMILAVGRACEPRINTASDYGMGEYALCVEEGFGAARKAKR